MDWYPKRRFYYQQELEESDEIEQGDMFWGVPSLFAAHPDLADRFSRPLAPLPWGEGQEVLRPSRVRDVVQVMGDPVLVLPHTCDFYGPEKERTHRARLVGRIQRLEDAHVKDPALARSGKGYNHTFFLPSWVDPTRDADDMVLNFRYMTAVDVAYLDRARRVARLSFAALIALRRRITNFFTDYAPPTGDLVHAEQVGGLVRGDLDPLSDEGPPGA